MRADRSCFCSLSSLFLLPPAGCDLELRNPDSHRTLLQHACAVGAHKIVRALLQRGAEFDPNRDPASDALALAVACGHFLAASEIIAVADNTPRLTVQLCNMRRGAGQDTLLHMACRAQSPAIARLLLEKRCVGLQGSVHVLQIIVALFSPCMCWSSSSLALIRMHIPTLPLFRLLSSYPLAAA